MSDPTKKKRVVRYMHTLDGVPAYYDVGRGIVRAGHAVQRLCDSLAEAKHEIRLAEEWRTREGRPRYGAYGYVRVYVDV